MMVMVLHLAGLLDRGGLRCGCRLPGRPGLYCGGCRGGLRLRLVLQLLGDPH
jgi:hypothetical protein